MAVATFYPPGRASEWASPPGRAEVAARLVSATAAHALYAKSQLSAPVHALRRAHARTPTPSSSVTHTPDPILGHGVSVARPLVRPGARVANDAMRGELLSTLDSLESTLRSVFEAGMQAYPREQEVDVAFLFGPGLLFPKHLFGMTILLPASAPSTADSKAESNHRPKALGLGDKSALRVKTQQPRVDDQLKLIERRLLAFLVQHDTVPGEEDLSLPSSHEEAIFEPLALSYPSCDKIKKRAMKCHVALRAQPAFIDAAVAGQQRTASQPGTWVHKPAFHPRGLDQLFDAPQEQHSANRRGPSLTVAPFRTRPIRSWNSRSHQRVPTPEPIPDSDPPYEPSIGCIRNNTSLSADEPRLERGCERDIETQPPENSASGPSSPSRSSISWSGVVAGASASGTHARPCTPRRTSAPALGSALNSTPLRALPRDATRVSMARHSPLSVDSSPPSLETSLLASVSDLQSVSAPNGNRGRRIRRGGPVCGRVRLDLRRAQPPRAAVPVYHDSDESDGEHSSPRQEQSAAVELRTWAVFTSPLVGGGVGL